MLTDQSSGLTEHRRQVHKDGPPPPSPNATCPGDTDSNSNPFDNRPSTDSEPVAPKAIIGSNTAPSELQFISTQAPFDLFHSFMPPFKSIDPAMIMSPMLPVATTLRKPQHQRSVATVCNFSKTTPTAAPWRKDRGKRAH